MHCLQGECNLFQKYFDVDKLPRHYLYEIFVTYLALLNICSGMCYDTLIHACEYLFKCQWPSACCMFRIHLCFCIAFFLSGRNDHFFVVVLPVIIF
jgi:hypothetical protein